MYKRQGLDAACVLVDDLEISDERFYQKVRKQVKELKEKGQQVILLTNRPFTESLADKVYYLPINETNLDLIPVSYTHLWSTLGLPRMCL